MYLVVNKAKAMKTKPMQRRNQEPKELMKDSPKSTIMIMFLMIWFVINIINYNIFHLFFSNIIGIWPHPLILHTVGNFREIHTSHIPHYLQQHWSCYLKKHLLFQYGVQNYVRILMKQTYCLTLSASLDSLMTK